MLSAMVGDDVITGTVKQDLKVAMEMLSAMALDEATQNIKHCKLGKCWKQGSLKVQFSFTDKLELAAMRGLASCGADIKYGHPPAGALVRKLAKALGQ